MRPEHDSSKKKKTDKVTGKNLVGIQLGGKDEMNNPSILKYLLIKLNEL